MPGLVAFLCVGQVLSLDLLQGFVEPLEEGVLLELGLVAGLVSADLRVVSGLIPVEHFVVLRI